MKKIELTGISNREDFFCLTISKSDLYYPFLFKLLKHFDEEIPDIQNEKGNSPNILDEEDTYTFYGKNNLNIIEVIGKNKIFLFIITDLRDKLSDFIQKNSKYLRI